MLPLRGLQLSKVKSGPSPLLTITQSITWSQTYPWNPQVINILKDSAHLWGYHLNKDIITPYKHRKSTLPYRNPLSLAWLMGILKACPGIPIQKKCQKWLSPWRQHLCIATGNGRVKDLICDQEFTTTKIGRITYTGMIGLMREEVPIIFPGIVRTTYPLTCRLSSLIRLKIPNSNMLHSSQQPKERKD